MFHRRGRRLNHGSLFRRGRISDRFRRRRRRRLLLGARGPHALGLFGRRLDDGRRFRGDRLGFDFNFNRRGRVDHRFGLDLSHVGYCIHLRLGAAESAATSATRTPLAGAAFVSSIGAGMREGRQVRHFRRRDHAQWVVSRLRGHSRNRQPGCWRGRLLLAPGTSQLLRCRDTSRSRRSARSLVRSLALAPHAAVLDMMTAKMSEKDSREEILKAFRLFDDDEKGKISFRNLKRVAKELGETMTDEELAEMIEEADRDGDGEINEEEFLRIMKKTSLY